MPHVDRFLINASERANFPEVDNCGQVQTRGNFHKELHCISQTSLVDGGSIVHIQTSCLGVTLINQLRNYSPEVTFVV